MAKLCLPLGFVLAVVISADADNCLGGDCKAVGASSMLQSQASKAATAKKHYAEDVRPPANSSLVAKGRDHAMREQRHDGFDQVVATDEHDSVEDARGHYEKRNAAGSMAIASLLEDSILWKGRRTPSPNPVPSPSPNGRRPVPTPATTVSGWQQSVLTKHNVYRCMHGVPLLTWSQGAANKAQSWSDSQQGVMRHGGMNNCPTSGQRCGQNLVGLIPQHGWNEVKGVKMWYDEISLTQGGRASSFNSQIGHYTQVVWKGTQQVGCGRFVRGGSQCSNSAPCLLTCNYYPPGNMQGRFSSNVNAPVKSQSQCESELR